MCRGCPLAPEMMKMETTMMKRTNPRCSYRIFCVEMKGLRMLPCALRSGVLLFGIQVGVLDISCGRACVCRRKCCVHRLFR